MKLTEQAEQIAEQLKPLDSISAFTVLDIAKSLINHNDVTTFQREIAVLRPPASSATP